MFRFRSTLLTLAAVAVVTAFAVARPDPPKFTVIVMDPLAAPLSCACVKGYAQRDYDQLGKYLEGKLGRPVDVVYSNSMAKAVKEQTAGKADLIIGKASVVNWDCQKAKLDVTPVAALTNKEGITTQNGLIVVPKNDPAKTVADLKGYRILLGPSECEEKHSAILDLLQHHQVAVPNKPEIKGTCADAATTALEAGEKAKTAAVISSYAEPLLEGCGTIQKGDLRTVGKTLPVPFVMAFLADTVPYKDKSIVTDALLAMAEHPPLLVALETQKGFVPAKVRSAAKSAEKGAEKKGNR